MDREGVFPSSGDPLPWQDAADPPEDRHRSTERFSGNLLSFSLEAGCSRPAHEMRTRRRAVKLAIRFGSTRNQHLLIGV